MLSVGIKYSMYDLICDVISYSATSFNMDEMCILK